MKILLLMLKFDPFSTFRRYSRARNIALLRLASISAPIGELDDVVGVRLQIDLQQSTGHPSLVSSTGHPSCAARAFRNLSPRLESGASVVPYRAGSLLPLSNVAYMHQLSG
jgi:hypothetical protein